MRMPTGARQSGTLTRLYCAATAIAAAVTAAGAAAAADIRVFTSGAPAEVEKVLAEKFARESGHRVVFTVRPRRSSGRRLRAARQPM